MAMVTKVVSMLNQKDIDIKVSCLFRNQTNAECWLKWEYLTKEVIDSLTISSEIVLSKVLQSFSEYNKSNRF